MKTRKEARTFGLRELFFICFLTAVQLPDPFSEICTGQDKKNRIASGLTIFRVLRTVSKYKTIVYQR